MDIVSETIYGDNDKCIKTKLKIHEDKVKTKKKKKKVPKENASCKCLSLIMLDCVIKARKMCYSQTLSEECEYEIRLKQRTLLIMIQSQVHLMMNLTMNLIMRLNLIMNLEFKAVF